MHYIEEFVKTYKFTVRLKLLGFSVNPEHIHGSYDCTFVRSIRIVIVAAIVP